MQIYDNFKKIFRRHLSQRLLWIIPGGSTFQYLRTRCSEGYVPAMKAGFSPPRKIHCAFFKRSNYISHQFETWEMKYSHVTANTSCNRRAKRQTPKSKNPWDICTDSDADLSMSLIHITSFQNHGGEYFLPAWSAGGTDRLSDQPKPHSLVYYDQTIVWEKLFYVGRLQPWIKAAKEKKELLFYICREKKIREIQMSFTFLDVHIRSFHLLLVYLFIHLNIYLSIIHPSFSSSIYLLPIHKSILLYASYFPHHIKNGCMFPFASRFNL